MKFKSLVLAAALCLPLAGCANRQPVSAPIPGAINAFDSNAFQTLATTHAFVVSVKSHADTLTPTEKAILNQLIVDLNTADAVYKVYHNAGAPVSQESNVSAALSKVNADQAAAIQSGVK